MKTGKRVQGVRRYLVFGSGLLVPVALSIGGGWIATRLRITLPGPVLGLAGYTTLLLLTPWLGWTLPAARWLSSWLGALIVPALVGIVLFGDVVVGSGVRLALVLVVSTAVTGLVTAWLFRAVGGHG